MEVVVELVAIVPALVPVVWDVKLCEEVLPEPTGVLWLTLEGDSFVNEVTLESNDDVDDESGKCGKALKLAVAVSCVFAE